MPLERCRACGKEVGTEGEACPQCGASFPLAERPPGPLRDRLFSFVVVAAVGFLLWISPKGPRLPEDALRDAYVECQVRVMRLLRAPSAVFPAGEYKEHTRWTGNSRYQVRSYVDLEDSNGARVRRDVLCDVTKAVGEMIWTLDTLIVGSH